MPISMTITAETALEFADIVWEFSHLMPQRTTEPQYELTDAGRAELAKEMPPIVVDGLQRAEAQRDASPPSQTNAISPEPLTTKPPATAEAKAPLDVKAGDPLPDDLAPEPGNVAKRGRKPKDKAATTTIDAPEKETKPTLEHIQARIVGVLQNAKAKFSAEGDTGSTRVKEYILRMLGEFGVAKASDLPVEKYAEFLTASEAYLEGTA